MRHWPLTALWLLAWDIEVHHVGEMTNWEINRRVDAVLKDLGYTLPKKGRR